MTLAHTNPRGRRRYRNVYTVALQLCLLPGHAPRGGESWLEDVCHVLRLQLGASGICMVLCQGDQGQILRRDGRA